MGRPLPGSYVSPSAVCAAGSVASACCIISCMICRLWRGWATKDNADAYERIVRGQVIPGIEAQRIPGFRSIDLVRRERDHDVEFMTLMWFSTLDSVKAFMGNDYEVAHVPAEAQAVLADFDKRSAHFEVLDRREQPL